MDRFIVGKTYKRKDVLLMLGLEPNTTGKWSTGYVEHNGDYFIFANVGSPGRTGHKYNNRFINGDLEWRSTARDGLQSKAISAMLSGRHRIYVFTRERDRDPFTFQGLGRVKNQPKNEKPVVILWAFDRPQNTSSEPNARPLTDRVYREGRTKIIRHLTRERNSSLVKDAKSYYKQRDEKLSCKVCGFSFEDKYGERGKDFIEMHHVLPVSHRSSVTEAKVTDLVPVCANCHRMIHRRRPWLTIDQLRRLIQNGGNGH